MMQYFFITVETLDGSQQLLIAFDANGNQFGIPADPLNADYLEYVKWLFDGNTAEEWQPNMEEGI